MYIQYIVILEAGSALYNVAMQYFVILLNEYFISIIHIRENKEIWNILFALKVIEMDIIMNGIML